MGLTVLLIDKLNSAGETIVEVLFAVVVIGSALTGAYYTANRSSKQTQAAVERTEALKAAESKVEALRALSKTPGFNMGTNTTYCIDGNSYNLSTNNSCGVTGSRYTVTTTFDGITYTFTANWDSVLGAKENLSIYYRP